MLMCFYFKIEDFKVETEDSLPFFKLRIKCYRIKRKKAPGGAWPGTSPGGLLAEHCSVEERGAPWLYPVLFSTGTFGCLEKTNVADETSFESLDKCPDPTWILIQGTDREGSSP